MVHSETLVKGKLNLEYINDFFTERKKSLFSIFASEKSRALWNTFLHREVNSVT